MKVNFQGSWCVSWLLVVVDGRMSVVDEKMTWSDEELVFM